MFLSTSEVSEEPSAVPAFVRLDSGVSEHVTTQFHVQNGRISANSAINYRFGNAYIFLVSKSAFGQFFKKIYTLPANERLDAEMASYMRL